MDTGKARMLAAALPLILALVAPALAPAPLASDLSPSHLVAAPEFMDPGEELSIVLHLLNAGDVATSAEARIVLAHGLEFIPGSAWASGGTVTYDPLANTVTWLGELLPAQHTQVGFLAEVDRSVPAGALIEHEAGLSDLTTGDQFWRQAVSFVTSPFDGYNNTGKLALDGCHPWECEWFECAEPCDEYT